MTNIGALISRQLKLTLFFGVQEPKRYRVFAMFIASECGKSLYLIATQAAYDKFGIVNPYKRATSIEHAFYVRLAEHGTSKKSLKNSSKTRLKTKAGYFSKKHLRI